MHTPNQKHFSVPTVSIPIMNRHYWMISSTHAYTSVILALICVKLELRRGKIPNCNAENRKKKENGKEMSESGSSWEGEWQPFRLRT